MVRKRALHPISALAGILDTPPWTSGTHDPSARVNSWSLLVARGLDSRSCHRHMIRDICGMLSTSQSSVVSWLATPCSIAGAGMFPDSFRAMICRDVRCLFASTFEVDRATSVIQL